jgi:23S rRNA (cytosine1962-C5)-methyltransferase
MDKVYLKPREEERIRLGHPWVFDNEIGRYQGDCPSGSACEVLTKSGSYLGTGIINRASKITIRIFSRERGEALDASFIDRRIERAIGLRAALYPATESVRLVFAESDLLPGFICDRFVAVDGKVYLACQFLTLGAETFKDDIVSSLLARTGASGIYERSDVRVRELEGLEQKTGWLSGSGPDSVVIRENGIELSVDIAHGQKTGYFLDQKHNRALVASLSSGKRVLDTFTHTGAFGLNAWKGGASEVECVDISEEAVANVRANIALNGADSLVSAKAVDAFDLLKEYDRAGRTFDLVILDPPAFTKSAKMIDKAYGGYKEINLRAMKILERGGYLVTCSCSHFFGAEHFYRMLQNAARDSGRTLQILGKYGPGPDHPSLVGYPESEYLKCLALRVW